MLHRRTLDTSDYECLALRRADTTRVGCTKATYNGGKNGTTAVRKTLVTINLRISEQLFHCLL